MVESVHSALQLRGIDPAALRQLCQRSAAVQVATALVKAGGEGKRLGPADAVAALRGVVAYQPGFRRLALRRGSEQCVHEVMVAIGFVDEASAIAAHSNEAGFGAVDQVREMAEGTIFAWYPRNRCPGTGLRQLGTYQATGLFTQAQAVAAVFFGRGRVMPGAIRRMRHQLSDALAVVREAATGQHHTPACVNRLAIGKQRAADPAFPQQAAGRLVGQQRHTQVQGAAQQACHQCVAIDQLLAASV
ncbi:hypothetical protein D3C81_1431440 [compost metagenome]